MKKNALIVKIMAGAMAGVMLLVTLGGIIGIIIEALAH